MGRLKFSVKSGQGGCGGADIEAGFERGGMAWAGCVRIAVENVTNLPADDAEALGNALISAARVARDNR